MDSHRLIFPTEYVYLTYMKVYKNTELFGAVEILSEYVGRMKSFMNMYY